MFSYHEPGLEEWLQVSAVKNPGRGILERLPLHTLCVCVCDARACVCVNVCVCVERERERDLLEAEVAVAAVAGSRRVGHGMQTGLKPSSGRNTGHSFPRQQELVCSFQRARVLGGHLKLATPRLCMHLHQAHPHSLQAVRNRVQHCTDRALLGDCAFKRMAWPHWRHHDPYQ